MTSSKYRRIADAIADEIKSGERPPGSVLPSHSELSAEHGNSTATAVLRLLKAEGWAVSVVGAGTYVADPLPDDGPTLEERVAELERRMNEHEGRHPNR